MSVNDRTNIPAPPPTPPESSLASHVASYGLGAPPPPFAPPPSTSNWQGGLARFFERPVVQGLYYNGKLINLDGYQFVGCRFDNCTLVTSSTNFEIVNCVIDPSTAFQYGPEPLKIIQLFNAAMDWIYEHAPHLAPVKNADGTISITGKEV